MPVGMLDNTLCIRLLLDAARSVLSKGSGRSLSEAQKWIEREARAKRASLGEVAWSVLSGEATDYHYNVPI
jgi:hypothetical protein